MPEKWYPDLSKLYKLDHNAADAIRLLWEAVNGLSGKSGPILLESGVNLMGHAVSGASNSSIPKADELLTVGEAEQRYSAPVIVREIQAGGAVPLNLTGLIGSLNVTNETENSSGLLARLDGTGTFSGARTISAQWTFSQNLRVSGTGSHVVGGTTQGNVQFLLTGTFDPTNTEAYGFYINSRVRPFANKSAYNQFISGFLDEAGSGTHADFASLGVFAPFITAGGASLTNASTVKIINAPTAGVNNYALWVAGGASKFDGTVTATSLQTFSGAGQRVVFSGAGTSATYAQWLTTGGNFLVGLESSVGGSVLLNTLANSAFVGTNNATPLHLVTNSVTRITIDENGLVGINKISSIGAQTHIVSGSASRVGLIVNTAASATADAQLWQHNTTNSAELFASGGTSRFRLVGRDLGNDVIGTQLMLDRNTNAGPEGGVASNVALMRANGTRDFIWIDNAAKARIHTAAPTGSTGTPTVSDTAGRRIFDSGSTIVTSDVGPHAIGGAAIGNAQLLLTGNFFPVNVEAYGFATTTTINPSANRSAYTHYIAGNFTEAGSGTHADFAGLGVEPPFITGGAAALTNASSVKILGAPTGATNNYALWVAAGASKFDGTLTVTGATTLAAVTATSGISSMYQSNLDATTVAASTTTYAGAGTTTGLQANKNIGVTRNLTIKNLVVRVDTQPASGSLVFTLHKNEVATSVTVTHAAGGGSTTISDTTNSFTTVIGDRISLQIVNNATASTGILRNFSWQYDATP